MRVRPKGAKKTPPSGKKIAEAGGAGGGKPKRINDRPEFPKQLRYGGRPGREYGNERLGIRASLKH